MDSELTTFLTKYEINLNNYDTSAMTDIFINHNVDNYINDKKMFYYQSHKENGEYKYKYGLMKKFYMMAIKKYNKTAMNNLGNYYINVEKKPILGIKYLKLAVEHNCIEAMNCLGNYYRNTQNIELMIKYYTLSCYQNNSEGMFLFGNYYESIKDYETMEKYYMMAIDRGHLCAKKRLDEYNSKLGKEMDDKFEIELKELQMTLKMS